MALDEFIKERNSKVNSERNKYYYYQHINVILLCKVSDFLYLY